MLASFFTVTRHAPQLRHSLFHTHTFTYGQLRYCRYGWKYAPVVVTNGMLFSINTDGREKSGHERSSNESEGHGGREGGGRKNERKDEALRRRRR